MPCHLWLVSCSVCALTLNNDHFVSTSGTLCITGMLRCNIDPYTFTIMQTLCQLPTPQSIPNVVHCIGAMLRLGALFWCVCFTLVHHCGYVDNLGRVCITLCSAVSCCIYSDHDPFVLFFYAVHPIECLAAAPQNRFFER